MLRLTSLIFCAVPMIAIGNTVTASAQIPPIVGFQLSKDDKLAADLNLTDEQKTKIRDMESRLRRAYEEALTGGSLSRADRLQLLAKIRKEEEKSISEILNPQQLKRLKEIELQMSVGPALLSPEISQKLEITDEQKAKIVSKVKEFRASLEKMGSPDKMTNKERYAALAKLNKEIEAILTPEQRTKWNNMKGKPFVGK